MNNDFALEGLLANAIKGFRPRESQQIMAEAVIKAITDQSSLVVEAGTGTGKTFAYLVPALRSDKKVIISTASKALQDQLFNKDLPLISRALKFSGKTALLKGRSNYLCLEKLVQQFAMAGDHAKNTQADLARVRHWSSQTQDGDISKCTTVAEDSPTWSIVTSTNDNCLGSDCPNYEACFVVKARKRAMSADVVVVNHHLFLADVVVKESGFGELIPKSDIMIFDEAHQIPDIASHYFGEQLSSRQFIDVAKEIILTYRTEIKDIEQLQKCADLLIKRTQDFRLALGDSAFKGNLRHLVRIKTVQQAFDLLKDALQFCYDVLKMAIGRSVALDACFERITEYTTLLVRLFETETTGFSYWFECTHHHFVLGLTPLSISDRFRELLALRKGSWIFTSATLSVNDDLSHYTERLGIESAAQILLPSPFDYATQSLLCVPRYLPAPNDKKMAEELVKQLSPVIEANRGRCFFLCTSHQMMRDLAERFRETLTLPVLMQGETSKTKLLEQFVTEGNALLVATSSFWEGVDVRGDTLSCVIIDKLPFTSPDDPLLKARTEDCVLKGQDPFTEIQIPEAVITLKQGVGRLIRDHQDRGVIIICDNRLVMRSYGAIFLNSLPPIPRTRNLDNIIDFLEKNTEE